ncbi:hypothetical protein ACP4OV_009896 [Aristida adscensionis]
MAGVMASAATGAMDAAIGKLMAMLGEEYRLVRGVKRGVRFLRDELSSMNAVLQRLADMEDGRIDAQTREWRSKVRELSYDIDDCIDRFMLRHGRGGHATKPGFVRRTVRRLKTLWEDRKVAREIHELKSLVEEESERRRRYSIDQSLIVSSSPSSPSPSPQPVAFDPRARALFERARDLVGIEGPRDEIVGFLRIEEKKLKVVSIFGTGGLGKTTLAMEVYHSIEESFGCRASVSVSRNPDVRKPLRDLLFQINRSEYDGSERMDVEQIIRTLREYLTEKRYLIIIDDIWGTSAWECLKSALPNNNNGSRLITTTRIKHVAKSCSGTDGHMYEAKHLSEDDSRRLFFTRMDISNEDWPGELTEVANDILTKCGGLPLAIISIAGLLANRSMTVEAWAKILYSISSAVEKDSPIDQMKRILFLSYYDLPHYLKTCLLYLSVFPEDHSISTKHLIWSWVAEGLIPGHNRESMEQLGESYFNELINRCMIQPTEIGLDGTTVEFCRVHDIILDFIISLAETDNFVTVLNSNDGFGNSSNKIRRLSLQSNCFEAKEIATTAVNVSHLRSLNMFGYEYDQLINQVPWYLKCEALRVLNIESSRRWRKCVGHIGRFPRLKYLRITNAGISKFSGQIGNLQNLETLDVRGSSIDEVPSSIIQLRNLVRLFVPSSRLPDGIGCLQALEELSVVHLDRNSAKTIQELGRLTKLRVLGIYWQVSGIFGQNSDFINGEDYMKVAVSSLSKLVACGLRSLHIEAEDDSDFIVRCMCASAAPIRTLVFKSKLVRPDIVVITYFKTIPTGICSMTSLTQIVIPVDSEMREEGLKVLASLPMLLSLTVSAISSDKFLQPQPRLVIGRQGFQRLLTFCCSDFYNPALKFEAGAMPKVQSLVVTLNAWYQFKYEDGSLVLGLENLSRLKKVIAHVDCIMATIEQVEACEDDIRSAAGAHPNHPILAVNRGDLDYGVYASQMTM